VRVTAGEAEIARARLLDLAPGGFEEIERDGRLELVLYADEAGEAAIRNVFPLATSTALARGWEERWRAFHRPVRAGGLWIGPPWESPSQGEIAVVVDPGRAFGTGAHATTRACLELLAAQERTGMLDAGCGSGVIAVAGARLGFRPVLAVDSDPVAVEVAQACAAANEVEVAVRRLDVLHDELPAAGLVVANIELQVVEALLARLRSRRAITSGYLAGQFPAVTGWRPLEELVIDGWAAHVLTPV
jgi:ribosomal protein L11 methyltransferase